MRRASPAKTRVGRQPAAHSDRQRRDRLGQSAVLLLGPASVAMLTAMLLLWPNRVHSCVGSRDPGTRPKPETSTSLTCFTDSNDPTDANDPNDATDSTDSTATTDSTVSTAEIERLRTRNECTVSSIKF